MESKTINTLLVTWMLNTKFSKAKAHVKSYDCQIKLMYLLIESDDLLEKYKTIQDTTNTDTKKEFDSKPFRTKIFWKTRRNLMLMSLNYFTIKKYIR